MDIRFGLKILTASTLLALSGCQTEPAPQEAPESLAKSSAASAPTCPKFEKFVNDYATDITTCSQGGNVSSCIPKLMKVFDPAIECLGMSKQTPSTPQDLGGLSADIAFNLGQLANDAPKAKAFGECMCGSDLGGGGEVSVGVTFTCSSSAAGGTFSGTSSAAGGSFSGSSTSAGGSFTGTSSAAGGTFGK